MDDCDVSLDTDGDCQVDAAGETNLGQGKENRDEVSVPLLSSYPANNLPSNKDYISDEKRRNRSYNMFCIVLLY